MNNRSHCSKLNATFDQKNIIFLVKVEVSKVLALAQCPNPAQPDLGMELFRPEISCHLQRVAWPENTPLQGLGPKTRIMGHGLACTLFCSAPNQM